MKKIINIHNTLQKFGINSYPEYKQKIAAWESFDTRVWHGGQEKIDSLRQLVVDYYESYQDDQLTGQYISISPDSFSDNRIANYMCLFPKRSLIETSALLTYLDIVPHDGESYDMPPNDFFKQYFRFQNLLTHDIAHLYPISDKEENETTGPYIYTVPSIIPLKNVADVNPGQNLTKVANDPNRLFVSFPWLYNAHSDDFIEISEKYPLEFEHFTHAIENIALANNGECDLQKQIYIDLRDALDNIQIACEKEKAKLKVKGITTFVGIALTCLPFIKPDLLSGIDLTAFQSIIGGASIVDGLSLIEDFVSLKKEGVEDPYWVIWKWKKETLLNE